MPIDPRRRDDALAEILDRQFEYDTTAFTTKADICSAVRAAWRGDPWTRDHAHALYCICTEVTKHPEIVRRGVYGFRLRRRTETSAAFPMDPDPAGEAEHAPLTVAGHDDAPPARATPTRANGRPTLAFRTRPVVEVSLHGAILTEDALGALGVLVQAAVAEGLDRDALDRLVVRFVIAARRHAWDEDAEIPGWSLEDEPDVVFVP